MTPLWERPSDTLAAYLVSVPRTVVIPVAIYRLACTPRRTRDNLRASAKRYGKHRHGTVRVGVSELSYAQAALRMDDWKRAR